MARIKIHDSRSEDWEKLTDIQGISIDKQIQDRGASSVQVFTHADGKDSLFVTEVRYPPLWGGGVHCHGEDELVYVLEGEFHAGSRVLKAGSSMFVTGNTLYETTAGPEGVRFLLIKKRFDYSFMSAEQFMEKREAKRREAADKK